MATTFFERPILNSPYEVPGRHHELDEEGQPTDRPPLQGRRRSALITPVPKPRKRKRRSAKQEEMVFADPQGLGDAEHLTAHLLFRRFRESGEAPKVHLFNQLKRIVRRWFDEDHLVCQGGTVPAQVLFQEIADQAVERIYLACQRSLQGEHAIKAVPDPYNPIGSTRFVNFTTSRQTRYRTSAQHCHVDWVVCDSDWEAELARVAEAHPRVRAYVKNQGLGLEVPYRDGAIPRTYLPDFILVIDDGRPEPLHLIVETKGYRKGDAQLKAKTMRTLWVPGVNRLGRYGRWAFAEFTEVFEIEAAFDRLVQSFVTGVAA